MTILCLMSPVSLLICLSILCALLIIGVCAMSAVVAKDIKNRKSFTETKVYTDKNEDKTSDCANIQDNCMSKNSIESDVDDKTDDGGTEL